MTPADFVAELDRQNSEALARIGRKTAEKTSAGAAGPELTVAKLLGLALKNEMEATECAAAWLPTTPEIPVKLALARQAGDEAKHYRLIQDRLVALGVDATKIDPMASGRSPLLRYLMSLEGTCARVAAGQFTREALALVRNEAFIAFCRASGDEETAKLYEDVIQPDERHHHELGRRLLLELAVTDEAREGARAASSHVLALAEELQEIARLQGVTRAPGC